MLDHLRARIEAALAEPVAALLITQGPGGLQASSWPCAALGLSLYLLVPAASDHRLNLDGPDPVAVVVVAEGWRLEGRAWPVGADREPPVTLTQRPDAPWSVVIEIRPERLHLLRPGGWGDCETLTIDN